MQEDRSAVPARMAGSVRGLGVCDVLRVELEPVQWAGLERGLATRFARLERRRDELRAKVDAGVHDERGDLERTREALRLLTRMKATLPGSVLIGPADLVAEVVGVCLSDAVSCVTQRLAAAGDGSPRCWAGTDELRAAGAWIATALDCAVVADFCFEAGVDPVCC